MESQYFQSGCEIRTLQDLPGHKDAGTTMICPHVLSKGGHGVKKSGGRAARRLIQTV